MKLHIVSDLHNEFNTWTPPETDADVVILAGDIHTKGRGVKWAKATFSKPVIFVPGNHDYYSGSLGHTLKKMREAAEGSHVHLMHNSEVVIDGVRFLGATLWTDYRLTGNEPLAQWDARARMTDFKVIRDEHFRKVSPQQVALAHAKSRAFLDERLSVPFEGKTVVVTHHAPCELSIAPRYVESGGHLNASYASRLDHLMGEDRAALWIHGHTHENFDYDMYGTRVLCNPRGYAPKDVNQGFIPDLVVEL